MSSSSSPLGLVPAGTTLLISRTVSQAIMLIFLFIDNSFYQYLALVLPDILSLYSLVCFPVLLFSFLILLVIWVRLSLCLSIFGYIDLLRCVDCNFSSIPVSHKFKLRVNNVKLNNKKETPPRDTEYSNIRWFEIFDIRWSNIESSNRGKIFEHRTDSMILYSIGSNISLFDPRFDIWYSMIRSIEYLPIRSLIRYSIFDDSIDRIIEYRISNIEFEYSSNYSVSLTPPLSTGTEQWGTMGDVIWEICWTAL